MSIEQLPDGSGQLTDRETGFQFDLSPDALGFVRRLPLEVSALDDDERDFVSTLAATGLTGDEGGAVARRRQAQLLRRQADERQWPQLFEALEYAAAHTRFHRRLSPYLASNDGPALLERLPTMRRDDVRAGFPDALVPDEIDLTARLEAKEFVLATTSGSADERLQVLSDTTLPRYPFDFEHWWNLRPRPPDVVPRSAVFTSAICAGPTCHLGRATMNERTFAEYTLFLNSTEDLFSLDEPLARNALDEIAAFEADLLFVNPVYLAVLVRKALELGLPLPKPRVVVSCYQMLTARHRALLEQALGCPVIDYYSATEFGGSIAAMECRFGVMHAWPERVRLEIIGRDGRPVDEGPGHLAVTTLNRALPLVRYLVGDVARWVDAPCSCAHGSAWPALRIEGRAKSTFSLDGRWVTPRAVDDAVAALPIDFYRLEQRTDDFVLKVIGTPGASDVTRAQLEPLEALLGRRLVVERTHRFRPERSQKYPTTVPLDAGATFPETTT